MDIKKRLQDLQELQKAELITEAEYNQRRERLLVDFGGDSSTPATYQPNSNPTLLSELMEGQEIGPDNHHFRLVEEIGGGAMGRVWKAHDLAEEALEGGTHYKAIKVVTPELLRAPRALHNLKQEASRASKLSHPNIINVYGWNQGQDRWLFVVMDYLEGRNLEQLLLEEGTPGLCVERVITLLKQMSEALDYAHNQHQIIHRDLKPGNVYITDDDTIKLLDFGLAYQLRKSSSSVTQSKLEGSSSGTPIYMPPEAFGAGKPDVRQDIYALACMTYELLTGEEPYSEAVAITRLADFYPARPESLTDSAWETLKEGFAYHREDRPHTAGEFCRIFTTAQQTPAVEFEEEPEPKEKKEPGVEPTPQSSSGQEGEPKSPPEAPNPNPTINSYSETSSTGSVFWKTVVVLIVLVAGGFGYIQLTTYLAQEKATELAEQLKQSIEESKRNKVAAREASTTEQKNHLALTPAQGLNPAMITLKGGCYQMGSPAPEKGRFTQEGPQHEVCLKGFSIGKYEVTQKQWREVMGRNPSNFKKCGDNCPVESVSWDHVQEYMNMLNRKTGKHYRLPTESEWEYAARAGSETSYSWGDKVNYEFVKYVEERDQYAWENSTLRVGSFPANSFGLYDMHGNVSEWVQDCWSWGYSGALRDGSALESGDCSQHVVRGGSVTSRARRLRSAVRGRASTDTRGTSRGFRVARSLSKIN